MRIAEVLVLKAVWKYRMKQECAEAQRWRMLRFDDRARNFNPGNRSRNSNFHRKDVANRLGGERLG